jgi:ABC-2 type transport system permease protein
MIWIAATLLVTSYLLPSFGLSHNYGTFILASLIGSAGLFEVFPSVVNLITDLEGDNITSFYIILPIPSWLVFVKNMIFYSLNIAAMAIMVLPIGKFLLWNTFSFERFSIIKFVIIFVLMCMFYAAFTIWTASKLMKMEKIQNLWMRFIFPLWYLGCFQYSFDVLKKTSPTLSYVSLLNPIVYIMEGMRTAVLGQPSAINFWVCAGVLSLFVVLTGRSGILSMKKRLDF